MQKVKKYSDWIKLTDDEKQKEYASWNVYDGEGENILKEVLISFKRKYSDRKEIIEINKGLYHGGIWTIEVTFKRGKRRILPDIYEGFPVMKQTKEK